MAHGNGEIPYIKVYNLTRKGFLDFSINPTYISRSTHEERLGRSKIFPGDVLMNIVGPPLGKVSIVPDYYPEWNTNQAVVVFRPWASLKSDYLACAFMCDNVLYWITRTAQATAGQFNISVSNCRKLPVPLPPEREQMLMVETLKERLSIIERIDAQVEANLKRATRLRQGILNCAFEGRLVPQDPTDETADRLLERVRGGTSQRQPAGIKSTRGSSVRRRNDSLPLFNERGDGRND